MIENLEYPVGLIGGRLGSTAKAISPIPAMLYDANPGLQIDLSGGLVEQVRKQSWSFASVAIKDVECAEDIEMAVTTDTPTLILALEEVGGRMTLREDSLLPSQAISSGQGQLTFLPRYAAAFGQGRSMKFLRLLSIEFDPDEFERVTGNQNPLGNLLSSQLMISDEKVEGLCKLIADECSQPGTSSLAYADSLVLALMIKLSRWKKASTDKNARGGLAPWQLRKSQAYILDHISEPVSLQVLADITGVSLAHFSRAFKSSTGQAPYHWLIASRIDKAKAHLLERELSITEISLLLGFCDQAHLTRTFTKMVGMTPMVWQRSHLS